MQGFDFVRNVNALPLLKPHRLTDPRHRPVECEELGPMRRRRCQRGRSLESRVPVLALL